MPDHCSLAIRDRQPLALVGRTQASSVNGPMKSSAAVSATVKRELTPLKESAFPKRPEPVHAALLTMPVLPLPLTSTAVAPAPSSNE